jgi:alginate O-acetyltransferase complex protein AlgJ
VSRFRIAHLSGATLAALFMVSLAVPLVAVGRGRTLSPPGLEGERTAPRPRLRLDVRQGLAFPKRFREYFDTGFGFRDHLITWHSYMSLRYLRASPTPRVLAGRDGWLFDNRNDLIEDYLGLRPFARGEPARWRREFEARQAWLAQRGIRYLVVLVPSSYAIYPEYLPANAQRRVGPARIDQLLACMRGSPVPILDLRPALLRAKRYGRLYHRTDAHWNQLGAYFGYVEIMRCLQQWFPEMRPVPLSEFDITSARASGGFLARMLGLADILPETDIRLVPLRPLAAKTVETASVPFRDGNIEILPRTLWVTECRQGQVPRMVAFRDSYGDRLVPYLSEHFGRAYYGWTWTFAFNSELVEKERPQVVIQEQLESVLLYPGVLERAFGPVQPSPGRR